MQYQCSHSNFFSPETGYTSVTVKRLGAFGDVQVVWSSRVVTLPSGYAAGNITPAAGTFALVHGVTNYTFFVQARQ